MLFKLFRWAITLVAVGGIGYFALTEFNTLEDSLIIFVAVGQFVFWPILLLWILPLIFRRRPPKQKKHDPAQFSVDVAHEHIAMDFKRDKVWIRDPVRGERYLDRDHVLGMRTASDFRNYVTSQRIEFQLRDLKVPMMHVVFARHSDSRRRGSEQNAAERDEWFARLKAWSGLKTIR
ncbi:hypothetical protein E2F46_06350 [Luteimonas aestuarii]|uniref:Uncharacterized protein n=1 Tax=Luteimonas aestuarii TaxID=453837 RepID=A0A4R5TYD3_9GAMM|nr:hypothetical protein [Luteimonas aestuarii]TDK26215.1 hypothetical protein E2F46_06350 [Luteimonas aestuarii]